MNNIEQTNKLCMAIREAGPVIHRLKKKVYTFLYCSFLLQVIVL